MFGISKPSNGGAGGTGENTVVLQTKENLDRAIISRQEVSKERKPMIVMTYDDGVSTDYSLGFKVHEERQVPMSVAVIGYHLEHPTVHPTVGATTPITVKQLKEIRDSEVGHEIVPHGMTHRLMGARQLSGAVSVGDTQITLTGQGKYFMPTSIEDSVECYLIEGDKKEIIHTTELLSANTLSLKEPLENDFTTNAYIRLSDEQLEYEIVDSKRVLEKFGFPSEGVFYPGARHCHEARMIMAKHYKYGRAVNHQGEDMITLPNPFPTYSIGCPVMEYNTIETLTPYMDEAVEKNGALFLLGHTPNQNLTEEYLNQIIDEAEARNMEFVTASEAVDRLGNMLEIGDVSYDKESHDFPIGKGYYAFSSEYKVYSSEETV